MFSAWSSLRCDLVLRNIVPFGVCRMYEHGYMHLATISPGLQWWVSLLRILTRCPACNAGSGPARRSWSRIMLSLHCCSWSLVSCWFWCIRVGWWLDSVVRIGMLKRISLGLDRLLSSGVHRGCCNAISLSLPTFAHFWTTPLTALTCLSIKPFDWGYLGDVVVCLMFHLLHMSSYGGPAYCGPLSVTISNDGPNLLNHCAVLFAITVFVV